MEEAERYFMKKESINEDDWLDVRRDIDNIMTKSKWNKEERSYNYEEEFSDTDDQSFDEESDFSDYDEVESYEDTDDQSYDEMSDSCDDDKMKSYGECPYCDDY